MILGIDASRAVKKDKTGVEWYSYFLLHAMEKCTPEGWRVVCYVPEMQNAEPRTRASSVRGRCRMQNANWTWKELKWIGRGWTQGRLSLEMMLRPPDVLFVPSHTIPLVHPERTVTTVHDVVFLTHPELYAPQDLKAQQFGLDFALKFAKKIIVPSKATRDDVIAGGGRQEQMVVVPHGVELEWRMENGEWRMTESPYIIFVGRIDKKKNVLGLIHAFRIVRAHNPDAKLILAGPLGYGSEDVLQAIKTFKLEDRVVHLGWVNRETYGALLRGAQLLVLPSFGEGFGLPVLEAVAAGVPVVCSDIPALREVGGNAVQYVNPRDPESIARGIETVLKNEMLACEMARRGKERAQQYSWQRAAKETWKVICSLTGQS